MNGCDYIGTTPELEHTHTYGPLCAIAEHDCPIDRFLDDPITRAYGVAGDFAGSIKCAICAELDGWCCEHESCMQLTHEFCAPCEIAAEHDEHTLAECLANAASAMGR